MKYRICSIWIFEFHPMNETYTDIYAYTRASLIQNSRDQSSQKSVYVDFSRLSFFLMISQWAEKKGLNYRFMNRRYSGFVDSKQQPRSRIISRIWRKFFLLTWNPSIDIYNKSSYGSLRNDLIDISAIYDIFYMNIPVKRNSEWGNVWRDVNEKDQN